MVCDVKTISNDVTIVECLGSRDILIEQKKRLNNAGKRPQTIHGPADKLLLASDRDEQSRKTSIANTRPSRQDFIGRPRSIFNIFVRVLDEY